MRRFLASAWFPLLTAVLLGGVTCAALAALRPDAALIGNEQIARVVRIAAWGIGPAAALLSLILAGVLNLLRRIVRLRRVAVLHPVVALLSVAPWLALSWQLTDEPRYTAIARAVIDFAARPLLWGALAATLFIMLCSLPLCFPARKP